MAQRGPASYPDSAPARPARRETPVYTIDDAIPSYRRHLRGWRDRGMLSRYGASAAEERARDAYMRLSLGDRLR